jgi:hypothetical protein
MGSKAARAKASGPSPVNIAGVHSARPGQKKFRFASYVGNLKISPATWHRAVLAGRPCTSSAESNTSAGSGSLPELVIGRDAANQVQ